METSYLRFDPIVIATAENSIVFSFTKETLDTILFTIRKSALLSFE